MHNFINKYKDFILLSIGTLLVLVSLCLLSYNKFELLKSTVFDEIEMEKAKENSKNSTEKVIDDEDVIIDNIDIKDVNDSEISINKQYVQRDFIGYLEISKINLKNGLVSKKSYYNNVDRNIQILDTSDYPDVENGNVILAAHSGTSAISFFKNLYKLTLGDEAKIYYKDNVYEYKIVSIYNVPKNGYAVIRRNVQKTCLTLITCTHNSDTEQTVYILERTNISKEGDSSE